MLTLNDGRDELWQWDTGRKLTVDADCSQVHFSNKVFGRSVDVDVVDGTAEIPDVLLQVDKELIAWAFVGTAENGYTKTSKVFKVNKRNKPADYVFTPHEQTSLEEIKEKLDYLENNPVEAPVQSVNGKTGKVELTAEDVGAISKDKLQEATNEALEQAKASGEFDGADGKNGVDGKDGKDGADGKSAYAYAQDAGYAGTEEEFAEKLAEESAGSGIHIGTDAPTDENINVWIDTDEEPEEVPGTGSGIDVTAEVGQTIIVEEVDGNGKPTKWKAVEYQPRTHYSTYEEVQLLDNVTFLASDDAMLDFFLVEGQSYRVIHNGTTYEEVAVGFNLDGIGFTLIGNPAAGVGDDNGKPYAILSIDGMTTQYVSMTGTDDTITLYTNQETVHEIPQKYFPDMRPYYVVISPDLDGDGTEMVTMETVESFTAALTTGRAIIAKVYTNDGGVQFVPLFSAQDSNNILLFNTYGASAMLSANDEGGYNVTIKFG